MESKKLYLHCGGHEVAYEDVKHVVTPAPKNRHYPIAHTDLIDGTRTALANADCTITKETFGLNHEGNDLFALFEIEHEDTNGTYGQVVGLRNSHIQHFAAGMCAGSKVFVCDNLAFSAEIKVSRKHTRFISRDLQGLLSRAVVKLADKWTDQQIRYDAYHDRELTEKEVHDLVIRAAVDYNALPNAQIQHVVNEWREPTHAAFEPRTAWSLFNCFTEVAKRAPSQIVNRTVTLHNVFDGICQAELLDRKRQMEFAYPEAEVLEAELAHA